MKINFQNKCTLQASRVTTENSLRLPDTTNLHWHGAFSSPKDPGDNSARTVGPGQSFQYSVNIPADAMPGTHWIHPHHHGSVALQVGGGAYMAFIVKDPVSYKLPP